ncbi:MAG: ABC transporter ATP-binding protein [Desulfamplus sp.]|nr:ABC transporter ATP-binding protein [Desulfamplus sp.]
MALDIDALSIPRESIIGLTGPNGSGKSTLLKLLAFAFRPSTGTILFNGKPEYPFSGNVRCNITLLTQEPYLLKRTVFENINYGLKIRGREQKLNGQAEEKIRYALSHVGLDFEEFAHRKWNELSGGEAQRVAMAARLVLKPQVLLLDEPTASVDVESAAMIKESAAMSRQKWGTTIVAASHDSKWLEGFCDIHLHLIRGRVVFT